MKTKPTTVSVDSFIEKIADETTRDDCRTLIKMMQKITGAPPVMWGPSIIGFGAYHYKYASGREGEWMLTGFSPRKQNLTLYINTGFDEYGGLLQILGKHSTGQACLYIKRLDDIDLATLKELVRQSVEHMVMTNR